MNSVEKISRLQTLLGRVQQRAKEPRGTSAGAVPVEASPIPPVAAVPRAAPAQIAITAPSAVTVSVDATLPFATRVPDDAIARSGMKSPLGSEPPGMQTDRAPAPARDSGAPEIEMGEVEAELEMQGDGRRRRTEVQPVEERGLQLPGGHLEGGLAAVGPGRELGGDHQGGQKSQRTRNP